MLPGRIWYMADVQKRGQVSRWMLAILRLGFVCADRGGQAIWSRPFGATLHSGSIKQLGGASEDARSYWQGRFAACALLTFPLEWSPAERLGCCPKPHKGRCPLTLQGADEKGRSPPLDPFRAIELTSLSYFFRVQLSLLIPN